MEKKIELDSLISRHELFTRRIKTLKQWIKRDGWDYGLRDSVRLIKRDKKDAAKKIVEAVSSDAIYREACKMLGIKGDSVGLAILTAKLPLHLPLKRLKELIGLIPNRNRGQYDHELRGCIADFATALYINAKKNANVLNEVAEIANRLPKNQAIYKLELITLKILRIAYLKAMKPLADG